MLASFFERYKASRVAFAVAAGAAAAALQWAMQPWVGARIPFLFFVPAILLSAMLAGRGPAFIVAAIGLANGILLQPPVGALVVDAMPDRLALMAYGTVGLLLVLLGGRLHRATGRAAEAEQRLRLVQEDTGVGLFEIDLAERTIFTSAALANMFGGAGTAGGHGWQSLEDWNPLLPAEQLHDARAVLKQKLQEGVDSYAHEHRMVLADGQDHWFFTKVHIEWDGRGRARRLRGATVDITERKHVDELLASTKSMLMQQLEDLQRLHELGSRLLELGDLKSQLQAILRTLVGFHGCQHGVVSLRDPAQEGLAIITGVGYSDAELNQLSQAEIGCGACGIADAEKRRIVVDDTDSHPCFGPYRELALEQGFRAVHCTPLISAGGEVLGVLTVHLPHPRNPDGREKRLADICARKAAIIVERDCAQATAIESDRRFRSVLDASAVPFNILAPVHDSDGRIVDFRWTYVNLAAAKVLWRPVDDLIGRRVDEVLPGGWKVPDLFAHFVAVAEQGETREFELHSAAHHIDGWFHVVASPLPGAVAVWFADVTERKLQEQALQEADRRKDEFLATLAHELRNPLAPIRQAALISKSSLASEEQKRKSHEVIERQVHHMSLLLDDLLDVSRITRGTLRLRRERIELAATIDVAVETARPLLDAKRHQLHLDLPPQAVHFEADKLRVAQVVSNLLTNAAKYTDPGGVICLHAEHADDELIISVTDNGIGIRRDALTDIFQMFTQVRSTQDRSGGGLGIGLALAKGLVELHGGRIVASSAGPGKGSRFTIRLPAQVADAPSVDANVVVPPQFTRARRIVVADDNRDAAETLAEFLRLQGHEVRVEYDGEAALAEFSGFQPDVVLLDIGMPGLNGNEVAQRIRDLPQGQHAMLIAITGWGQDKDRSRALAAGFDYHLTKPVDLQRLNLLLLPEPAGPPPGADQALSASG